MISTTNIVKLKYVETTSESSIFKTEEGEIITIPLPITVNEETTFINKKVIINNHDFILLIFSKEAIAIPIELFNIECVLECVDSYLNLHLKQALPLGFILLKKELYEFKIVYHNEYIKEINNGRTLINIPLRKILWFKETNILLKNCLYVLNNDKPLFHVNTILKTNYKGIFILENFLVSFIPIKSLTQNFVLLTITPSSSSELENTQEMFDIVPTLKYQINDLLEKIKQNAVDITDIRKEISHLDVISFTQQRLLENLDEIKIDVKAIEKDLYTKASFRNLFNTVKDNKKLIVILWLIITLFFFEGYLLNISFLQNFPNILQKEDEVNNTSPLLF